MKEFKAYINIETGEVVFAKSVRKARKLLKGTFEDKRSIVDLDWYNILTTALKTIFDPSRD